MRFETQVQTATRMLKEGLSSITPFIPSVISEFHLIIPKMVKITF